MSRLYWARNDGIGGHAWLSAAERSTLAREMMVQGMGDAFPVERFEHGADMHVTTTEIEAALEAASPEPVAADGRLWADWIAFLSGAAANGGLLVR